MPAPAKIGRIVLAFSENGAAEVEAMMTETGLPSHEERANTAYTLLQRTIQ